VGSDSTGWSSEFSFKSAPRTSPETPVSLIAYGDMGKAAKDGTQEHWEEEPSLNTTENVIKHLNEIDLVLHIGDIAYAVGYSAQWDQFFEQIGPVASRVPYMTCIGNHERDFPHSGAFYNGTDSGGECGVPYEHRMIMPRQSGQTRDQPWYSFEYGCIHFLLMSTEHNYQPGSVQYQFIENDLKTVDRHKTPWLIMSGHRPMYIDSTGTQGPESDQAGATLLRSSLEELLLKYKVDLAFWGHHHSYQRSCPVYQQVCQPEGTAPVHVVIGMAGMGLSQNLESTPPSWLIYVDDDNYGYTTLRANSTQIHFQYFTNSNDLHDEFTLRRGHNL